MIKWRTKAFRRRNFDAFVIRCNQLQQMTEEQINAESLRVFPTLTTERPLPDKLICLVKDAAFRSFDEP